MHTPVLLTGLTSALGTWILLSQMEGLRMTEPAANSIERRRQQRLSEASFTYHWFAGLVKSLAIKLEAVSPRVLSLIKLRLSRAGETTPWTETQWLATIIVESLAIACTGSGSWILWFNGGRSTFLLAPVIGVTYFVHCWRKLKKRSQLRLRDVRVRLPFVIDSIGLSMEASASFHEGITMAADSCAGTSIGQELSYVVADTRRGRPTAEALLNLKTRLQCGLIDEFITAGNTSLQLGAAMSQVLLSMSKRMRERRSHEIEAAAGRAQIKLYYPGTVLLIVCLLAVVAPFVAPMWKFLSGDLG